MSAICLTFGMRRTQYFTFLALLGSLLFGVPAVSLAASTPKIKKVLPFYLDKNGLNAVDPSLYERDAYQALLRRDAKLQSGMRFDVLWKASASDVASLHVQIELRGIKDKTLTKRILTSKLTKRGWFSTWSSFNFLGEEYREFGDLLAWRVTLWKGDQQVSEQKSFLW
jgi:hypothetical protein